MSISSDAHFNSLVVKNNLVSDNTVSNNLSSNSVNAALLTTNTLDSIDIVTDSITATSYMNAPVSSRGFAISKTSDQDYSGSAAEMIFDAVLYDTDGEVNISTNSYTIPQTGNWLFNISSSYSSESVNSFGLLRIRVNGTATTSSAVAFRLSSSLVYGSASGSIPLSLTEGDVITVEMFANSAGGETYTILSAVYNATLTGILISQ